MELRAGRLARRTVLVRRVDGEILLPSGPLFDLLEMDAKTTEFGLLEVSPGPRWPHIRLDPGGPEAYAGERPINPDDLRAERVGAVIYVGVRAVADLLSTHVDVDLEDLTVTLENVDHLPLGRRVARERAREMWDSRPGGRPPDVVLGAEPTVLRGAALTWGVSTPLRRVHEESGTRYRMGLGAGLLGGALDIDWSSAVGDPAEPWRGSWTRAWPDHPHVRQVRLGTIVGTGPHARALRGAAVSNAPYQRMTYFGESSILGRVPPSWDVEVWQDGRPVGFTRADEYGSFDAPIALEYGTNVLEIRAYGERGEEVWLSRAVQVDAERLPPGAFEYQMSWGECEGGPCTTQGNLDLRWGAREALTIRTGVDWFTRPDETGLVHPYTELVGAFRQRWLARWEGVAGALATAELGYHPTPHVRANVLHTVYDTGVREPVLSPPGVLSRSQASLFWRPDPRVPSRFVDASFGRIHASRWGRIRSRFGYHDRVGRVRWETDWQEIRGRGDLPSAQSLLGLAASTALSRAPFHRLHLRGALALDVRNGGLDRAGLSLGRSLGRAGRVELSIEWFSDTKAPILGLNMSTEGFGFRSASHVTRSREGDYSGWTDAEGSLVWNEAVGRLEATPLAAPGRGGISGSAFVDRNGNGVRDLGEAPLAGVRIQAGDRIVRTDVTGHYAIWDLPAFDPTEVLVNLDSAENPLLTSAFTRAAVAVPPNGYREVNVPLFAGVEVGGRVLRLEADREVGLGGVPVFLRHVVSGREHATKTFHDGEFYFLSVPPGEYEVMVAPEFLERTGMRLESRAPKPLLRASVRGAGDSSIDVRLVRDRDGR